MSAFSLALISDSVILSIDPGSDVKSSAVALTVPPKSVATVLDAVNPDFIASFVSFILSAFSPILPINPEATPNAAPAAAPHGPNINPNAANLAEVFAIEISSFPSLSGILSIICGAIKAAIEPAGLNANFPFSFPSIDLLDVFVFVPDFS